MLLMVPQKTAQEIADRVEARRRRAETSVRGAFHLSPNQLWKCEAVLHALVPFAPTAARRASLYARAERVEGLAWDKALRLRIPVDRER
jgi:hypothetical protein